MKKRSAVKLFKLREVPKEIYTTTRLGKHPKNFKVRKRVAWLSGPEFKVNDSYWTKLFSDIISLLSFNW